MVRNVLLKDHYLVLKAMIISLKLRDLLEIF